MFKDIFTKKEYEHFIALHVAHRILNDEKAVKDDGMLNYAEELLRNYVKDFPEIYEACYVSFNVHVLIHLVRDVRRYRVPCVQFSAYIFEMYNGSAKRLVKSSNAAPVQIGRRIYEMTLFQKDIPENQSKIEEQVRLFSKE